MALPLLLDKPCSSRRFKSTLKDHLALPKYLKKKKKANVEGSFWELDVRTLGNKMRLWPYCCTPSLQQEDRVNYSTNYYMACETKERKQHPYYFSKK